MGINRGAGAVLHRQGCYDASMIQSTSVAVQWPHQLPAGMAASMALLPPPDQPLVLFTRHSIREPADGQGFASYALPLTPAGRELARQWGTVLPQQSGRLWASAISSPIGRCIDTAVCMLDGLDATAVTREPLLVEPGSLVLDLHAVGGWFRQHGPLHFINGFLQQQLPGMKAPTQGVEDILRVLFAQHRRLQAGQLGLAVSHDTLLAAVLGHLLGQAALTWADWPEMMEGLLLWFAPDDANTRPSPLGAVDFDDCVLHWIWRGQRHQYRIGGHR